MNLGLAYFNKGQNGLALRHFSEALELNVYYTESYLNRGRLYYQIHRFDEALEDYNKALSITLDYAKVYNNRGVLYMVQWLDNAAMVDF